MVDHWWVGWNDSDIRRLLTSSEKLRAGARVDETVRGLSGGGLGLEWRVGRVGEGRGGLGRCRFNTGGLG